MATNNATDLGKKKIMTHVFGNLSYLRSRVTIPIGQAAADLVNFVRLPKNILILDMYETHDGANSAATTGKIGLAATPGGATTQVDDDYFILAGLDLNAAGRTRWNNLAVYPITTDDEYYVQMTVAGVTTATAAMDVEIVIFYEFKGNL